MHACFHSVLRIKLYVVEAIRAINKNTAMHRAGTSPPPPNPLSPLANPGTSMSNDELLDAIAAEPPGLADIGCARLLVNTG